MITLTRDLRRQLENTVRAARRVAEDGAAKSLEQLGVTHAKAPAHLSEIQTKVRNALRAHGRQMGDLRNSQTGTQGIGRLTVEIAYEHWHRMLFARFLAENDLLIEPESGMAISLDECRELARALSEDWLTLASRYAQIMLPQIFRAGDPVLEVSLPPETRSQLDDFLKSLSREIFTADDSLGWVYQFWQTDKKEEVDRALRSGQKAGADEIPAKTQLFTEDYMVWFLLHNTLGAWWAGKVLADNPGLAITATSETELRSACTVGGIEWTYLRFVREGDQPWRPAAGIFDGWPKAAKDITLLDPCMGSGHFLVFALPILAALRMEQEGLQLDAAIDVVLRDNLYGLELDLRCTQIAAFNLALAAWKRAGHHRLPALHLACSGLSLGVSKDEWLRLAERVSAELPVAPERDLLGVKQENLFSDAMRRGFERLYELFAKAPWLGSLIQPRVGGDLVEEGFADLEPLLAKVMAKAESAELSEMAVAAQGLAKAAQILAAKFTLVATNVPYLGRGKQDEVLKDYCEEVHPSAKADLATCFVERCMTFCAGAGSAALVTPQNWLFLSRYKELRPTLLKTATWNYVARLGAGAFETISGEVVKSALLSLTDSHAPIDHHFYGVDCSSAKEPWDKATLLRSSPGKVLGQGAQIANPDSIVALDELGSHDLLKSYGNAWQGVATSDIPRFQRAVWEVPQIAGGWRTFQSTVEATLAYGGRSSILFWEDGHGQITEVCQDGATFRGQSAWGHKGVVISQMTRLCPTIYSGDLFDCNCAVITLDDESHLPALWAYVESGEHVEAVRKINQKLNVTNSILAKVPFDLDHWQLVAARKYPEGLPPPRSNDPTQWLFNGHPAGSGSPLQVAVARLVGYRWPRQTGSRFPDCPPLGSDGLESLSDDDGIVPLSAIKGEAGAAGRLVSLLSAAYGTEWSAAKLNSLLADVGHARLTLDDWLRDHFFEEHCALFHQSPFIWHIWDGRRDGFNVLVNYHQLAAGHDGGKRLLEKLTHTYLGDWIDAQRRDQQAGVEGAEGRLAAAEHLKGELEKVLAGEPPYDLFVRWKPLAQQAIGWEPDVNDGVRMNIRPFMTARPFGSRAKNACILRVSPKISWGKDRGKEPQRAVEDFPWFWSWDQATQDFAGTKTFDGNRWNDLHYTRRAKRAALEGRRT